MVSSTKKTDRHDIYYWNIVESGIKHHNLNSFPLCVIASNTLNTKEILNIYYTEQKIYSYYQDTSIMVIYHVLSLTVL
jgi:hypothetical protein